MSHIVEWWADGRGETGRCFAYAAELASGDADYLADVDYSARLSQKVVRAIA